ncbi:50S ribosomal protein L35 [Phanerochaete sordida]|uniref:50S ribosomal protein L35 n=1 Tax=Phanerochaete sordida TaxID=48140 RepID=A0A9P3GPC5_9APHY|nr:50S ribosomal protein L35 [Phanerochaete sordida]
MFSLAARLVSTVRSFSTSAVPQYPKLKSHSGAKKRWRSLSNGKFKRAHPFHSHLNVNKTPAQKNRLAQTAYSNATQTATLKKLLPYGSP